MPVTIFVEMDMESFEIIHIHKETPLSVSDNCNIIPFEFTDTEDVSLMLCNGIEWECRKLVKKNSMQFYREMTAFLTDEIAYEIGDQIRCKSETHETFKSLEYSHCDWQNNDNDLQTYTLIYDIQPM